MKIDYWSIDEENILKENYSLLSKDELMKMLPKRKWSSILCKANKLNLRKRYAWTKEEDNLLISVYEKIHLKEVLTLFPNRTRDSIIGRAMELNLNSFDHPIWTEEQKQYIRDNWEKYPDIIMAKHLNKSKHAVKRIRNSMGLHRQDKSQRTYENIAKYIRGNIYYWKLESMKQCNYCCVLTGSKEFEIHHLYPVNKMIDNIFKSSHLTVKDFSDYTQEELDEIMNLFYIEQSKYPLGECVRKDLHVLFHSLYGQYNTTIEQWEQFKYDYKNGIYNNYLKGEIA